MLKDPLQLNFDTVDWVGFALKKVLGGYFHVGLLYKVGKHARLRHQCEHNHFRDEKADNSEYLWTDIRALSPLNKRLIANKMSRAGGDKVPYGVGYRSGRIYLDKKSLKYINSTSGDGLTCSSYIVAVLETLSFKPFDFRDWNTPPEDIRWQRSMNVQQTQQHPEATEHFAAAQALVGQPRIRPDHVMGSASPQTWPLKQAEADELGMKIVETYTSMRE